MGAVEVLIDHLNGRVGRSPARAGRTRPACPAADIDLRVGGVEHVLDELGPLIGVPATIAALEQEVIALGDRLDLASRESEARAELVCARSRPAISVAESNLTVRHGADREDVQDVDLRRRARQPGGGPGARAAARRSGGRRGRGARGPRGADHLLARGAGRPLGTATSASGSMAESMVGRLELIERDIAEIEARFEGIVGRVGERSAAPTATPEPAAGPKPAAPKPGAPSENRGSAPRRRPGRRPSRRGRSIINEASFEVLRSLGCSVTQTATDSRRPQGPRRLLLPGGAQRRPRAAGSSSGPS